MTYFKLRFVKILIGKIQNVWSSKVYRALMSIIDFDDDVDAMEAAELREVCMMSLNDLEPAEAAKVVLTHLFPDIS
jgi:hypothetical protein